MMAGNHDPMTKEGNPYGLIEWGPNVTLIDSCYSCLDFPEIETSIISISWDSKGPMYLDKERLEVAICQAKEENKILLMHGDIYHKGDYLYMEPKYLESLRVDYVALGHIHKQDIIEGKIAYPGSLEPLDFSETGDHGFIAGSLKKGQVSLECIPSMVYPMRTIDLDVGSYQSYLELLDGAKDKLLELGQESGLMVRLVLIGELDPLIQVEEAFIKDLSEGQVLGIAYLEYKDKTIAGYDMDQLYAQHEEDLIGFYIRAMEEKGLDDPINQKALKAGIQLLLEAMN
jgi:hypothetical protein